jgi:hypothetical protein
MGYATQQPYQYAEIYTNLHEYWECHNVASSSDLGNFYIPDFNNPISIAYVDLIHHCREERSGVLNMLQNAGTFGIKDSGGTYRASDGIPQCMNTLANAWVYSYHIFPGTVNMASYITPGATQALRIEGATANTDSLAFFEIIGRLRLYFAV